MTEIEIYKAALKKWGPEHQTRIAFEEMAELQKELCKAIRGEKNMDAIAEEIADVSIMLGQMILLHECADEVEEWKARKLERLEAGISEDIADVTTVRHGKWIPSDIPCEQFKCSVCGGGAWYYEYTGQVRKSRFCPNCGAEMENARLMENPFLNSKLKNPYDWWKK